MSGLAGLAASAALLAGCPTTVPEPDACEQPGPPDGLGSLELGHATLDSLFEPWVDGEDVPFITGPQGGTMIAARIRLDGEDLPACFAQTTTVSARDGTGAPGEELGAVDVPLHAYPQEDGALLTRDLWLIFDAGYGAEIIVETTTGEEVASVALRLVEP